MSLHCRFYDTGLSICQLPTSSAVPTDILGHAFTYFYRTHDEITLICPTEMAPKDAKIESGFIPFELVGPFAFDQIGILTQIADPLRDAGISIIALSSFNTDWVLIKADQRANAEETLRHAGHRVDRYQP